MFVQGNQPFQSSPFPGKPFQNNLIAKQQPKQENKPKSQELNLPRFLNYYADYSGCGHWRMIWPEQVLNAHQKAVVHGTTVMNVDERYYIQAKGVRIQRQATPQQLEFVKWVRKVADKNNFRLIYEIDDICFHEDIPDYNKYKTAFTNSDIRKGNREFYILVLGLTLMLRIGLNLKMIFIM